MGDNKDTQAHTNISSSTSSSGQTPPYITGERWRQLSHTWACDLSWILHQMPMKHLSERRVVSSFEEIEDKSLEGIPGRGAGTEEQGEGTLTNIPAWGRGDSEG